MDRTKIQSHMMTLQRSEYLHQMYIVPKKDNVHIRFISPTLDRGNSCLQGERNKESEAEREGDKG